METDPVVGRPHDPSGGRSIGWLGPHRSGRPGGDRGVHPPVCRADNGPEAVLAVEEERDRAAGEEGEGKGSAKWTTGQVAPDVTTLSASIAPSPS